MHINFWLRLLSCLAIVALVSGCGIAAYEAKMFNEQERLKYFDKEEDYLTGPVDRPRDPPKKDPNSKEPDLADIFFRPPKGISTKFTENDKPYGPYFQRYQRTATNCAFLEVSVAALNDMPVELVVANPKIKSIKDFGPQDKIAVTTVKISTQALLLEMAAAKEFGDENYEKLDSLTVSMPHPDALTALLSNSGGITAHFSSPPFEYQEKAKGMRAVISNYDILGGKATFNVVWSTTKFKNDNPKAYDAFVAALSEATDAINKDPKAAAETYKRMSKTAESLDELVKEIKDPQVEFTLTPHKTLVTAQFMAKIGRIKIKPAKWDELYFQNLHGRPGS